MYSLRPHQPVLCMPAIVLAFREQVRKVIQRLPEKEHNGQPMLRMRIRQGNSEQLLHGVSQLQCLQYHLRRVRLGLRVKKRRKLLRHFCRLRIGRIQLRCLRYMQDRVQADGVQVRERRHFRPILLHLLQRDIV